MRTSINIAALLFLLASCSTRSPAEAGAKVDAAEDPLQALIKKIPLLPGTTYTLTFEFPTDSTLYEADGGSPDSLFFYPMTRVYGLLPDTSRFYSFLSYAPVENGALTLTTISKTGKILDSQQLSTGLYGWGCGYKWHGTIYAQQGNRFLMRDSLVTFDCDSTGPLPEENWKHEIITRTAYSKADGKIHLSELERITVKR